MWLGLYTFLVTSPQKKMRLKEMCADEMPREKMLNKGPDALSNTELLAILLRTGRDGKNVIDMARELLLSGNGALSGLAEMSIDRLCEISGIGPGKAVAIAAAFELGRRASVEGNTRNAKVLSSPRNVFRQMNPIMDSKGIIRKAIDKKASSVILVHNHPSGQTFAAGFLQILRQAKRQVDYHLAMDTLAFGYMLPVIRAH